MWKTSWDLSYWGTHDNPASKITYDDIKESFLDKEGNSFHLREKTRLPPPQGFSQIEM
jgi:hypothetical protein